MSTLTMRADSRVKRNFLEKDNDTFEARTGPTKTQTPPGHSGSELILYHAQMTLLHWQSPNNAQI